jgi:hypothetical protein
LRKTLYISILIIVFSGIANAQISGQLFQYESELPLAEVYLKNSDKKVESDFDGYFKLPITIETKKCNLIFNLGELIIEIQNVEFDSSKLDLGKIHLPEFKSIEIDEYNELTESEKDNCRAIYHWTQLIGYLYTNELQNDYLDLNCKKRIKKFEFNPITKTVIVDWNLMTECK